MDETGSAVGDVQIRLGLPSIAENVEVFRVRKELLAEIEDGSVRSQRSTHDVSKAADVAGHSEALDVRRDQRLAREFACAVQGNGQTPQVLFGAGVGAIAVHGAARRKHKPANPRKARGFESIVRRDRALIQIEPRPLEAPACFGIGGEVKNDVVRAHGARERVQAERVSLDERGPSARQGLRDEFVCPTTRSSNTVTGPRSTRPSTRWLPMKPAPPTTNERITSPPAYRKNFQFAELQGAFGRELRSRTKRARS